MVKLWLRGACLPRESDPDEYGQGNNKDTQRRIRRGDAVILTRCRLLVCPRLLHLRAISRLSEPD